MLNCYFFSKTEAYGMSNCEVVSMLIVDALFLIGTYLGASQLYVLNPDRTVKP
jgi:hypothetical protein